MDLNSQLMRLGGLRPIVDGDFFPLTNSDVEEFERLINARLPVEYRQFLMRFGASKFREQVLVNPIIPFPPEISSGGIDYIRGFYGKENSSRSMYDLTIRYQFYKERMPDPIIPIATTGGLNQYCMDISEDNYGRIVYWDAQEEFYLNDYLEELDIDVNEYPEYHNWDVPPERLFQNIHKVADSFEEFFVRMDVVPDK